MESVPTILILSQLCADLNRGRESLALLYKAVENGEEIGDCVIQRTRGAIEAIEEYLELFSKFVNAEIVQCPELLYPENVPVTRVKWQWKEV